MEDEIEDLEDILGNRRRIQKIIIKELENVIKKFPTQRKTTLVYEHEVEEYNEEEHVEDYAVTVFLSKEGYFKKITPQSLRMSNEQKFKDGDSLRQSIECSNAKEIIFLTNQCQAYKMKLSDFEDSKASVLGDYLPQKLGMDEGEAPVYAFLPGQYKGSLITVFENGKIAKVELSAFETKSNRKKLTGAYSDKSPLKAILPLKEDMQVVLVSTEGRALIFSTAIFCIFLFK